MYETANVLTTTVQSLMMMMMINVINRPVYFYIISTLTGKKPSVLHQHIILHHVRCVKTCNVRICCQYDIWACMSLQ
jgi:hypothetical protein